MTACGAPSPAVTLVSTAVPAPPAPPAPTAPPAPPEPPAPAVPPVPVDPTLAIGPAGVDTVGGWLPDGVTLSPFDAANPILARLDPALLLAVQEAARSAQQQGVELRVTSGWRSKGFQQRLFEDAVQAYGSIQAAAEYVATPAVSRHVTGQAIDIGPAAADNWLIANGSRFGLCQIYANEIWHFELAADAQGRCPPLLPNAAG
ncbi:MAG: M15 family metallopeptidase [Mycobacterium sp.]|nr:M15 family metallopeptidase [Mycobacterium sp.]